MPNGRDITAILDGSFEGLLTLVYKRYYEKLYPTYIVLSDCYQQRLDTEYVNIETDVQCAEKVMSAIPKKISKEARDIAYTAYCAEDENKFISIYKYLALGFSKGASVNDYMQLDYVLDVLNYAKYVGGEAHLYKGFVRFKEAKGGILFAEIEPLNNVLPFLAEHFANRLIGHPWIIYDTRRQTSAIYDGKDFIIAEMQMQQDIPVVEAEDAYQGLWIAFIESISNDGRKNKKLQTQMLPKRYRRFMTEFRPRLPKNINDGVDFNEQSNIGQDWHRSDRTLLRSAADRA